MKPVIKDINNKLTQLIKIAERYHYQKEFDKHNCDLNKMWQIIRQSIAKKTSSHQDQEFLINCILKRDKQFTADTFKWEVKHSCNIPYT